MKFDTALYSDQIITPSGIETGVILIENGNIIEIIPLDQIEQKDKVIDYSGYMIIPGLIDTHVHVNEPGRTHWEGFETATKAAIAGGITTIIDMPLNSDPVTTSVKNLNIKKNEMTSDLFCQVGFHGGIIPGSETEISNLDNSGIFAFKIFTIDSGIDSFPPIQSIELLEQIMTELSTIGKPLMVHAELPTKVEITGDPVKYMTYLKSRPKEWENRAIELIINLARKTNCKVHIIHLSSAEALPKIRRAKSEGVQITVETCPHYLVFTAEEIQNGETQFKCAPPIREAENREQLWQAIGNGTIDFIASDHSPSPPDLKNLDTGNFLTAWGGISSLQFSLQAIWKEARSRGIDISTVVTLMASKPAEFLGLQSKGKIEPNYEADLVIFDPDKLVTVTREMIYHRHKVTPYLGQNLLGQVIATYIRGTRVYQAETGEMRRPDNPIL